MLIEAILARIISFLGQVCIGAFELDGWIAMIIREKRLSIALGLLTHSDRQPISQVAYTSGFTNQRQFFKALRRQFGFSPSDAGEAEPPNSIATNIGGLAGEMSATRAMLPQLQRR